MHSASYSLLISISLKYPQHSNTGDRKSTVLINNNNFKKYFRWDLWKVCEEVFFFWLVVFFFCLYQFFFKFVNLICFVNKEIKMLGCLWNWRPVTVLCIDYKILSKWLSRLKQYMDQTHCLPRCSIYSGHHTQYIWF